MSFYKLLDLFTLSVPIILILGSLAILSVYKFLELKHKILFFYLLICLLTDISSRLYGRVYKNNLIFIILFGLLELILFSLFYQLIYFNKKNKLHLILTLLGVLFIIWELMNLNVFQTPQFQPYSRVVDCFIIVVSVIIFFFEKIKNNEPTDLNTIRLNSVILVFFSINLLFLLPINFIINTLSDFKFYLWSLNLLLTLSFYIYLIFEIWKNGLIPKQLQSGL